MPLASVLRIFCEGDVFSWIRSAKCLFLQLFVSTCSLITVGETERLVFPMLVHLYLVLCRLSWALLCGCLACSGAVSGETGGETWQRGTDENTNLLLRQYFPRSTHLSAHSRAHLDQSRLNKRPRKSAGFKTRASKLQASVASTV
jgi:hypothetical protein